MEWSPLAAGTIDAHVGYKQAEQKYEQAVQKYDEAAQEYKQAEQMYERAVANSETALYELKANPSQLSEQVYNRAIEREKIALSVLEEAKRFMRRAEQALDEAKQRVAQPSLPVKDDGFDPFAIPVDGLVRNDKFALPRRRVIDQLVAKIKLYQTVRVAAPPGTGKTALASLLAAELRQLVPERPVHYVSCLRWNEIIMDVSQAESDFLRLLKISEWDSIYKSTLILDDASFVFHSSFGTQLIKDIATRFDLKLVFLNAFYGTVINAISPVSDYNIGYKDMRLDEKEVDELFNKFLQHPALAVHNEWLTEVMKYLKHDGNGHCGLIRTLLHLLLDHFRTKVPSPPEAVAFYRGANFLREGILFRRFFNHFLQNFRGAEVVLRKVLSEGGVPMPPERRTVAPTTDDEKRAEEEAEILRQLIRHTVLVEMNATGQASGPVQFASSFHLCFYSRELYPSRAVDARYASIEEMAVAILRTFTVRELGDVRSRGANLRFWKETHLQHLFLRGALYMLPTTVRVSSGVTRFEDAVSSGELDFLVDSSYQFGFELLVGDGNITEHLKRGAPGGKYACFNLREYRVIHFKWAPWKPQNTTERNYIAVEIAQDCERARILACGGEQIINFAN